MAIAELYPITYYYESEPIDSKHLFVLDQAISKS